MTFGLGSHKGTVGLFCRVPPRLRQFVERQFAAPYPDGMVRRGFAPALALIALVASAGSVAAQETLSFTVEAESYSVDRYPERPATAPRPVVIVVHGIDGMSGESGRQIGTFASQIADKAFVAFVPHYFDKSDGPDNASIQELAKSRQSEADEYRARVAAAIAESPEQKDADVKRLGLPSGLSTDKCQSKQLPIVRLFSVI